MKKGKLKKLWNKYRPDKQTFRIGDGSQQISYKIKRKSITIKFNKEFEDDVQMQVVLKGTGDILDIKKEKGLEARFVVTKPF